MTARHFFRMSLRVGVLLTAFALASSGYAQASVHVRIPDMSAAPGTSVAVPVEVDEATGLEVYALEMTLNYDPTVLAADRVWTAGTIAQGWGAPTHKIIEGRVKIAGAGTRALEGSGPLVYIGFTVIGDPGAATTIHFAELMFNEGEPAAVTEDGLFRVEQEAGIALQVYNQADAPAVGAEVHAYSDTTQWPDFSGETDASGYLSVDVPDGMYTLVVFSSTDTFIVVKDSVTAPSEDTVRVSEEATVTVTVSATQLDGSPLSGASIRCRPTFWSWSPTVGFTDEYGHLTFNATPRAYHLLLWSWSDLYYLSIPDVALSEGINAVSFDVASMETGSAVTDLLDFEEVQFTPWGSYSPYSAPAFTSSDIDTVVLSADTYDIDLDLREWNVEGTERWSYSMDTGDNPYIITPGSVTTIQAGGAFAAETASDSSRYDPGDYVYISNLFDDAFDNRIIWVEQYIPGEGGAGVGERMSVALKDRDGRAVMKERSDAGGEQEINSVRNTIYPSIVVADPIGAVVAEDSSWGVFSDFDFTLPDPATEGVYDILLSLDTGPHQGVVGDTSAFAVGVPVSEVTVSIPDTSADAGAWVVLPVDVSNVTGLGIYSVGMTLTYDRTVLRADSAWTVGTIAAGWGDPIYNIPDGMIRIGMAGTGPLVGSGALLKIGFTVVGVPGDSTAIHFADLMFNEGDPPAVTEDGEFRVPVGLPVGVSVPDTSGAGSVVIPVNIDSVVTGRGIYAVGMTLTFDPAVLIADSAFVEGTIADGWLLEFNSFDPSDGRIAIGMAGDWPLSGGSPLVYIRFDVVGDSGDSTRIHFEDFLFNEGEPAAVGKSGMFSVPSVLGWEAVIKLRGEKVDAAIDSAEVGIGAAETPVTYPAPPTPPPEYTAYLLLRAPDLSDRYLGDIRALGSEKEVWILDVNPHGNMPPPDARSATLSWDPSEFNAEGYYQLHEGYEGTGPIVVEDMRVDTSYVITGIDQSYYYSIVWSMQATAVLELAAGWNMISLPVVPEDPALTTLFPDATAAWGYEGGYVWATALETGKGYWVKVTEGGTYEITGMPFTEYSISLHSGWYMLGAVMQVASPVTDPLDLVSAMWGYERGYIWATEMAPGKGYWVKLDADCQFTLGSGDVGKVVGLPMDSGSGQEGSWKTLIEVRGTSIDRAVDRAHVYIGVSSGEGRTLEAPPPPPEFTAYGVLLGEGSHERFYEVIKPQGSMGGMWTIAVNPHGNVKSSKGESTTIRWDASSLGEGSFELRAGVDGRGPIVVSDMKATTSYQVPGAGVESYYTVVWRSDVSRTPRTYALFQNYPNPFNAETSIEYVLPEEGKVALGVYNTAGQRVRVLVDEEREAGSHTVRWDGRDALGSEVASGVYLCRMEVGDFRKVRKMILLR